MTIKGQSGEGVICLSHDFLGAECPVALTNTTEKLGDFRVIGDGLADTDSGIVILEADGLGGVGDFVTTNEAKHGVYVATGLVFDVALMGTLVAECRVRFADTDAKHFFMGFSDVNGDDLSLEDDMISGATTTITLTASDICGFFYDEGLTDDEDWHAVYNGGTTAGETDSTELDLDSDIVAGEWQLLRLEIDPNGTARWYVDGDLKKTVEGAASKTTDLGFVCGVESSAATNEHAYIDYVKVEANRDWNA